jgi:RNA polymerase sigma factor (sigma-70 family)
MVDEPRDFAKLLEGLRDKNPASTDEMYRLYGPFIRAAVRRQLHPRLRTRFDSLDFVQDVWASFFALPTERYHFDTPQALQAFLVRMAYNRVIEVFRQRFGTQKDDITRETSSDEEDDMRVQIPSNSPTPSQWVIAGETWEQLLSRLPSAHRKILERLREGYTYEDIARLSNVSVSTVDRVVRRLKEIANL